MRGRAGVSLRATRRSRRRSRSCVALVAIPGLRAARDRAVHAAVGCSTSARSSRSRATSAFGRDYLDLELVLALFGDRRAQCALVVDRPGASAALGGRAASRVPAALARRGGRARPSGARGPRGPAVPARPGAPARRASTCGRGRGLARRPDRSCRLLAGSSSAGSARRGAERRRPASPSVAFCSVLAADRHRDRPVASSSCRRCFALADLVRPGAPRGRSGCSSAALVLAAVNLARTKPRLQAAVRSPRSDRAPPSCSGGSSQGEVLFVAACALRGGRPDEPAAAGERARPREGHRGPRRPGPRLARSSRKGRTGVRVDGHAEPSRDPEHVLGHDHARTGQPVRGAQVLSRFDMLDMDMGEQSYRVAASPRPGTFSKSAPALVMVGHWALRFEVTPVRAGSRS